MILPPLCWKYWIPSKNSTFSDHYIELPYDLSKVMFVTTANAVHNIPRPLLDRMEVLYISGYTEVEKEDSQRLSDPKANGRAWTE